MTATLGGGAATPVVEVRTAVEGDRGAVLELARVLGRIDAPAASASTFQQILAKEDQTLLVAVRDGRVIGWSHVFIARRPGLSSFAEIGGLVTDAENRRRGVGALLLSHSEDWARARRQGSIRVRCNVERSAAHGFYAAAGYQAAKRQTVFDKKLEDDEEPNK